MADPRFHKKKGPFTLAELAAYGQCEVERGDPSLLIEDVAPLDGAEARCIGLFNNATRQQVKDLTKPTTC